MIDSRHSALVELRRSPAAQMDAAELEAEGGPSTRLSAAYLSALKDLGRVLAVGGAEKRPGGKLAQLRSVDGGRQAASV